MSTPSNTAPIRSMVDGLSLAELVATLWGGRVIIICCTLLAIFLSGLYLWLATPIYQANALIYVEGKRTTPNRPALEGRIEGIFEVSPQVQAEVQILQSNQVLGRVIQELRLDLITTPKVNRLFGSVTPREKKNAARLEVEVFDLPDKARGEEFTLECERNSTFNWKSTQGQLLAKGTVGTTTEALWQGQSLKLKVRDLVGKPGQSFTLKRRRIQDAIEDLRKDLTVSEKIKESNVLSLTFQHSQPELGAAILNAIMDHYIRENIERMTGSASQALSFIQEEMSKARGALTKSEQTLGQFRTGAGAADLSEEARLVIQRRVDIEKETLALRQKREDLLRTYQEQSDVVTTLDQQIAKLKEEGERLNAQSKRLPRTQQEVHRLTGDAQVNQDQYNFLRNLQVINSQQLKMAQAGDIRTSRIVDYAMPGLKPVKPLKRMVIGLAMMLGVLAGVGIIMLRRALHPGVEDPQILASQLGLPVLATIPHSNSQVDTARDPRLKIEQPAVLCIAHPNDITVESLRSLRTCLQFSLVDAPNKAIMFAGSSPGIGKSFVSTNFAIILAQYSARVLLLDADLRKGKIHRMFGAKARKDGLSEILSGQLDWKEALHHAHGIDMISTGTLPPNPSELLHGKRFGVFLDEVCEVYDYVIIDTPPILAVTDAILVGAHVGAVLLVVKDGQHTLGELRAAMQSLDMAGIKAKGFVFNNMMPRNIPFGAPRYGYNYQYKYKI